MSPRPRIRIYLDICDVGGRGGEVQVTWTTEDDQRAYMAHDLDNAADRLKPILRRLMYGADQPNEPPG